MHALHRPFPTGAGGGLNPLLLGHSSPLLWVCSLPRPICSCSSPGTQCREGGTAHEEVQERVMSSLPLALAAGMILMHER